tara:strand:+ start:78 stop:536 length:459 start_codon:yes stop_codon:yes gene_type:complete
MAQTKGKTGTQSGKRDTRNIRRKIRKLQEQLEGKGDSRVTTAYGRAEESYSPYGESIKGFKMKKGPEGQVQGDDYVKIRDPKVPEDAGFTTIDANRFGIDTRFSPKIGKTTTMDKKKKGMKAGGSVKAKKKTTRKFRGDGIARKGKTKGRMI